MGHPSAIAGELASRKQSAEAIIDRINEGDDLIVALANGEPVSVIDAIEAAADCLRDVRIHQMLPMRPRPYMEGGLPGLRHVSYFLSPANREAFHRGGCDLVPNNFSEVPNLMRRATRCSLILASVSPPDRHGFFSLGPHADYIAAFIGRAPFFVEVNHQMPRTFGANQIHVSQVVGWCEADRPLLELAAHETTDTDRAIASLVADRISNGATLQVGVGAIPNEVLKLLGSHRELGIHTELFGEGFIDLVEKGVVTGTHKRTHPNKVVCTSALGSQRMVDFVDENAGIEFWPVDYTNDPRNICREPHMTVVNATLEVDFLGQCASESLGSYYYSSSGGQPDFARGALFAEHGRSFIVLHSTTHDASVSRIRAQLQPGAAVTTFKNVVDCVVTEYGVAELNGSSIRERTKRLIAIAHPKFREDLEGAGRRLGYL